MPELKHTNGTEKLRAHVVAWCGLTAIGCVAGILGLAAFGREPSPALGALAGAALGALTGILPGLGPRPRPPEDHA